MIFGDRMVMGIRVPSVDISDTLDHYDFLASLPTIGFGKGGEFILADRNDIYVSCPTGESIKRITLSKGPRHVAFDNPSSANYIAAIFPNDRYALFDRYGNAIDVYRTPLSTVPPSSYKEWVGVGLSDKYILLCFNQICGLSEHGSDRALDVFRYYDIFVASFLPGIASYGDSYFYIPTRGRAGKSDYVYAYDAKTGALKIVMPRYDEPYWEKFLSDGKVVGLSWNVAVCSKYLAVAGSSVKREELGKERPSHIDHHVWFFDLKQDPLRPPRVGELLLSDYPVTIVKIAFSPDCEHLYILWKKEFLMDGQANTGVTIVRTNDLSILDDYVAVSTKQSHSYESTSFVDVLDLAAWRDRFAVIQSNGEVKVIGMLD